MPPATSGGGEARGGFAATENKTTTAVWKLSGVHPLDFQEEAAPLPEAYFHLVTSVGAIPLSKLLKSWGVALWMRVRAEGRLDLSSDPGLGVVVRACTPSVGVGEERRIMETCCFQFSERASPDIA